MKSIQLLLISFFGMKNLIKPKGNKTIPWKIVFKLINKNVVLPIINKKIPIIADDYSDPEKGSGVVKITPAHDFNDFEIGKKHNLEMINILNPDGTINKNGSRAFEGMDRFEARKKYCKF